MAHTHESQGVNVKEMKMRNVAQSTRASYRTHKRDFICWISRTYPELVNAAFVTANGADVPFAPDVVLQAIDDPYDSGDEGGSKECPILLGDVKGAHIVEFLSLLMTFRTRECKVSTYESARSGIKHLWREFGVALPPHTSSEVDMFVKGISKNDAKKKAAEGKTEWEDSGKKPVPKDLYNNINRIWLRRDRDQHGHAPKEFAFARCFVTLCWNLMSRSHNTFDIHLSDIDWKADALQIAFAQMKNDQAGTNCQKYARHIYANPFEPEICPILALALYWVIFSPESPSESCPDPKLFPGSNQYERFRKQLDGLHTLLEEEGYTNSFNHQHGCHSFQKGAATYCASGTTNGPSYFAIRLRCGRLEAMEQRYVKFQDAGDAGDQFVGRTVTGLPAGQPEFGVLPPFFTHRDNKPRVIGAAVRAVFPTLPDRLIMVGEFCLASLLYHRDYLLKTLPQRHFLREALLVKLQILQEEFSADDLAVEMRLPRPGDSLTTTGVPDNIRSMMYLRDLGAELADVGGNLGGMADRIVEGVSTFLKQNAVGLNQVTHDELSTEMTKMKQTLENSVSTIKELFANHAPPQPQQPQQPLHRDVEKSDTTNRQPVYYWDRDSAPHAVPQDFKWPSLGVELMWIRWCCGNDTHPPFRNLKGKDLPNPATQRRFRELKDLLMKPIDNAILASNQELPTDVASARKLWPEFKHIIDLPEKTPQHRLRRRNQLSWRTVAEARRRILRQERLAAESRLRQEQLAADAAEIM